MTFAEPTFETDLDTEGFTPTEREQEAIAAECDRIRQLIEEFPTQILHINVEYNSNSEEYEIKLALVLPGQTFATGDVSESWEQSLEKSVQKMIRRIEHYKATMSGEPEQARMAAGTTMEVEPNRRMDGKQVAKAVEQGNYLEFRKAMYPIEESLRERVGRWLQRYPQIQAKIGNRFTIADIVEETFIMAFDNFNDWQPEMLFGQWVETLIDPAMKAIARDPEGELEAISFQQTWNEV
ncbi:hypothetical protein LF1_37110 [Rubripirellula obstinata]|uniref:Sigma 54 modulation protein / S30EA ribosomal protein n=1 Tax=Rubripirellula obstinata TaxID=406547 RepID=A0A5B1CKU1_9BACT|nr:HPF/RaiA family ribosome-associated protein [Rubripirellula obstinata]KAA1261166.1 hypothetical protein LF1_37110 [Rubripirellula obstinata]